MERAIKIIFWGHPRWQRAAVAHPKRTFGIWAGLMALAVGVSLSDEIAAKVADKEADAARKQWKVILGDKTA